jgi:hypothetical protein
MKVYVFVALLLVPEICFGDVKSTYDQVIEGKSCQESRTQSLDCKYKVGKDLFISIPGIGQPNTGVTFLKSDWNGDFYATFGIMHGCVIVKRGDKSRDDKSLVGPGSLIDFAFISPRNGKVYKKWEWCQERL